MTGSSASARRVSGIVSFLLVALVITFAGGCWLRTDAPELSVVSGISTDQILKQFELESVPPLGQPAAFASVKPVFPILHPDPLDLPAQTMRIATTAPGSALLESMAKAFRDDGFRGSIVERRLPATIALQSLCDGQADIVQIDRPPTPSEIEGCADRAVELVAVSVALDRIVLVAHPDNFWFGQIRSDQIASVLTATSWNEVDDRWPRRPLRKYLPAPSSPEMNAITRAAWFAGSSDLEKLSSEEATYQEDVIDRLASVAADPESLAFVPMGELRSSTVDFVIRPIDADDPLLAENYPIERTIRLVVAQSQLEQRAELATFMAYYLNRVEILAHEFNLATPASLSSTRRSVVDRLVDDAADAADRGPLSIDELP